MARSKKFNDLVQSQAKADKKFAEALLREGIDAMLSGDVETGKSLLRHQGDSRLRGVGQCTIPKSGNRFSE